MQEKKPKIAIQIGGHGSSLGFLIETIIASFDVQVTPILPTKFRVDWPRGVGGVVFQSKLLKPHEGRWALTDQNSLH